MFGSFSSEKNQIFVTFTQQINRYKSQSLSIFFSSVEYLRSYHDRLNITTVAWWVTHSARNTEDMGSIPGTGRYVVARMTT